MKIIRLLALFLASAGLAVGATNDITTLVQKGLFEEEANHNLTAAMEHYQTAIGNFDQNRKLVATAVFRLGECYRKQGRTNEANVQYQRILQEFSDQTELAKLSSEYGSSPKSASPVNSSSDAKQEELRASRRGLSFKASEANRVLGFSPSDKLNYFTIIEPDAVLQSLVNRLSVLETEYIAATNNYGIKSPTYLAAKSNLENIKAQVDQRLDGLIWGMKQRIISLGEQVAALDEQLKKTESVTSAAPAIVQSTNTEDEEIRKIKTMIQNSPDLINTPENGTWTPLDGAARNGSLRVAEYLIANGADINGIDQPPLLEAGAAGNKAMIELLLSKGAEINAASKSGETALHAATARGFKSVVELLLAHHADVNARDKHKYTPLHRAASAAKREMVQLLIDHGADVNASGEGGYTPLHAAARQGNSDIIQLLIDHKADVNAADQKGLTPLLTAVSSDKMDLDIVKILLAHGANIEAQVTEDWDSRKFRGYRAIGFAINLNHFDLLQLLLANHANPNAGWKPSDNSSMTPLYLAMARSGSDHAETVECLLDHGADPNLTCVIGSQHPTVWIPLHSAVQLRNKKMVEALIAHHANVNALDASGNPPINYASSSPEIADLLRKAGADENFARRKNIYIARQGKRAWCFYQGTNVWNQYTLLELIAFRYALNHPNGYERLADEQDSVGPVFPDFAHVTIHRLDSSGRTNDIKVDVTALLQAPSRTNDIELQWGDIVELPELDHPIGESWKGLFIFDQEALQKCVARTVAITVKGETTNITIWPPLPHSFSTLVNGDDGYYTPALRLAEQTGFSANKPGTIISSFRLDTILHISRVLRASSDTTRIKVKRLNPSSNKIQEMIFNLADNYPNNSYWEGNDLWLRDGDIIEIPERDPNAPVIEQTPSRQASPFGPSPPIPSSRVAPFTIPTRP